MTAIVLAGGKSSRLGRDKALEHLGDTSIIECVIGVLEEISKEILVVTRPGQARELTSYGGRVRFIEDDPPGHGPLGGLHSGLLASKDEYAWVVGCDMPFLNVSLLKYQMKLASGYDAVVPRMSGLQPLHSVYSKSCLPQIKSLLRQEGASLHHLLSFLRVRYVDEGEIAPWDRNGLSFFNINTEADLEMARTLLSKGLEKDQYTRGGEP